MCPDNLALIFMAYTETSIFLKNDTKYRNFASKQLWKKPEEF